MVINSVLFLVLGALFIAHVSRVSSLLLGGLLSFFRYGKGRGAVPWCTSCYHLLWIEGLGICRRRGKREGKTNINIHASS